MTGLRLKKACIQMVNFEHYFKLKQDPLQKLNLELITSFDEKIINLKQEVARLESENGIEITRVLLARRLKKVNFLTLS